MSAALEFNHAMIYVTDLRRSLKFYRDRLGFEVIETYPGAYARLKSPKGKTTIALHLLEKGKKLAPESEGVRLYFEVRELDDLCRELSKKKVVFDQMPETMPWGWRHAYLRDPDGHEISLYRAGRKRFQAS